VIIRSIVIEATPNGGFFRTRRKAQIEIWLDEKPIGRNMRPKWQQVRHVKGRCRIDDIEAISQMITQGAHGAIMSEDAGLLIRGPRYPDALLQSLTSKLSRTIERLSLTREAA
jgi:hypothetical protein